MTSATRKPRHILTALRWPVGGIRTHILYSYPVLLQAGYRFSFVGPAEPSFQALAKEWRAFDEDAEFTEAPVRKRRCRLWPTVRRLLRTGDYDLIHTHGMTAAAHVAFANWGPRVPHVVSVHDVFRPSHVAGPVGRTKVWVLDRLLRGVDTVVAVSDDVRDNLIEYLPSLKRGPRELTTVMYGIDTARFTDGVAPETPWLRERLGLGPGKVLIGFLGRFMEQKGFLPLLDALELLAADCPTVPFHLVAVGSGDCEQRYRAAVERKGLSPVVSFLDFVPDVAPILRQLDLLAIPSLWEAAPLLALEALCAGVPVVGSDCIGLREVLRGSPSRIVPAGDAPAWAAALKESVAAPWTEAARAYAPEARERFDMHRSARLLERVFDHLLAARRQPVLV